VREAPFRRKRKRRPRPTVGVCLCRAARGDAGPGVLPSAQTRCLAKQGGMPSGRESTTHESAGSGREQYSPLRSGRRFAVNTAAGSCACGSLGGCVTSTARSGLPCDQPSTQGANQALVVAHSGDVLDQRRALVKSSRGALPGRASISRSRIGDDRRVPRLPDCHQTPPPSSVLARPASPAPSPSKTTRPPVAS
jgi:hypothetical protein